MVADYTGTWNLTDINDELPDELKNLLGGDAGSLSTVTTVSAQNGIGGSGVSRGGGDMLQQTPMLDVSGTQNHQQLSQLLSGNTIVAAAQSSPYGMSSTVAVSRHATVGVVSATAATNVANPGGGASRATTIPGIVTTVGQVTNNIVTLSRQGNITLVPAGTQGANTVIGGHRVPAPTQQQQPQLVAINTGVGNAGATLLSVTSPKATVARLQPMSSANIGAVMSLSAAGMVINVSQSQPALPVSANGNHFGTTLVMPRGTAAAQQRFTGVTVQQAEFLDGSSGNVGLSSPTQMAMPAIAGQQMGTRVRDSCYCVILYL